MIDSEEKEKRVKKETQGLLHATMMGMFILFIQISYRYTEGGLDKDMLL